MKGLAPAMAEKRALLDKERAAYVDKLTSITDAVSLSLSLLLSLSLSLSLPLFVGAECTVLCLFPVLRVC